MVFDIKYTSGWAGISGHPKVSKQILNRFHFVLIACHMENQKFTNWLGKLNIIRYRIHFFVQSGNNILRVPLKKYCLQFQKCLNNKSTWIILYLISDLLYQTGALWWSLKNETSYVKTIDDIPFQNYSWNWQNIW